MYNNHSDILAFHNDEVTLPQSERREMRERRDTNRQRQKHGLRRDGQPAPSGFQSQGSYAHRTMVQQPDKDYDIDDGTYFRKAALKGPKGGNKTARDAKEMVRKALHDDRFNKAPEVRTNCVRVYYSAGYHVDVPVYRTVTKTNFFGEQQTRYEIASSDWKESDPVEVTRWFNRENKRQSPDTTNGRQLRRVTRMLKAFARSRESWRSRIATGFMITTLIVGECYRKNATREDKALYDTMVAIRDRLQRSLEIAHPTVDGEWLTRGWNDGRAKFLLKRLESALVTLRVLFRPGCTRAQALKAWDKVFDTTFFSERVDNKIASSGKARSGVTASILIRGSEKAAAERPVDKRGGGRYA